MNVRAKFRVENVKPADVDPETGFNIYLVPVTSGSEENKRFYRLTPGGQVTLMVVSPETAKQFTVGKEFYVDFTEAEAKVETNN